MNIGQLDGQPLALQIFNGMTAESTCVNERWAKDQLFRCVCFAGGRHQTILDETVGPIFQSPSSVWRTTKAGRMDRLWEGISIHVLRVEDDRNWANGYALKSRDDFNPRPPCGGRRRRVLDAQHRVRFQSTSSVWRTTGITFSEDSTKNISIHVLRVEDDSKNREKSLFAFI